MSIVHTEGIVLKTYDYSETSKIAVIFTKDYGKIKVMAKGAKSKKSNTQAVTEPGTYIRLVFYYKSDKELLTLSEATIIDQYPKVRTDLVKFAYYMYVLELIEVLFESDEGGSRDFFTECIAYINTFSESDNPELYVIALEVKMLKAHGHMFECQKCVECGKNVPRDLISSANRTELHPHNTKTEIYLSTVQGGVIAKSANLSIIGDENIPSLRSRLCCIFHSVQWKKLRQFLLEQEK